MEGAGGINPFWGNFNSRVSLEAPSFQTEFVSADAQIREGCSSGHKPQGNAL